MQEYKIKKINNIGVRLSLLVSLAILIFGILSIGFVIKRQENLYKNEKLKQWQILVGSLTPTITNLLAADNLSKAKTLLDSIVSNETELSYINLVSIDNKIIYSTNSDKDGKKLTTVEKSNFSNQLTTMNGISVYNYPTPIKYGETSFGMLYIGFNYLTVLEKERFTTILKLEKSIMNAIKENVVGRDYYQTNIVTKEMIGKVKDVVYFKVLNDTGLIVSSSRNVEILQNTKDKSDKALLSKSNIRNPIITRKLKKRNIPILEVSIGIFEKEELSGIIKIGYNLSSLNNTIKKGNFLLFVFVFFSVVIAVIIAIVIATRISRPITRLTKIAEFVGGGNLDVDVQIDSGGNEVRLLGKAFNEMIKGLKERDIVKNTFSRYVTKQVAEEILKNPDEIMLGGRKQEVTVLFSDIRGFTSLAEKMSPEKVVALLNEYLTAMVDIVFANDGTLDKFIGDAVMAVFGVPVSQGDDVYRAVKTGLEMQEQVKELNSKWVAEGNPPLKIGIGINTGEVIAGNIGSAQRMEYTVIGDNVNLASRIETLTKQYDCPVLISESTWQKVSGRVESSRIEGVSVKGKSSSVNVYQVFNYIDPDDNSEKRRYRRKTVQIPLNFQFAGRDFHIPPSSVPVPPKIDDFNQGIMQNISGGGMCFFTRQHVSENENIEVKFELNGRKYEGIVGRVLECSVRDRAWGSELGVRDSAVNVDCSVRATARNNDVECSVPGRVQVSNLNPQRTNYEIRIEFTQIAWEKRDEIVRWIWQ